MAGHSRPEDGWRVEDALVARLCPAVHLYSQGVDARDKRGHDVDGLVHTSWKAL